MGASQGVPARQARIAQEAHPLLIQITEGQSQVPPIHWFSSLTMFWFGSKVFWFGLECWCFRGIGNCFHLQFLTRYSIFGSLLVAEGHSRCQRCARSRESDWAHYWSQDEESVELADHDHKQNKDTEQGNDPLKSERWVEVSDWCALHQG